MVKKPMPDDFKINEHCPFWSTFSLKCRLCNSGLFIPLDDHMEVYCTTPEYPMCLQYGMNASDQVQVDTKDEARIQNRRSFQRLNRNFRVTLVKMTETGQIAQHFSLHANTLDISRSGMRLTTTEKLIDDTRIAFSFVDVFPDELQSGTATIKWCRQEEDAGFFQAGLAFETPRSEAAGLFLKLASPEN